MTFCFAYAKNGISLVAADTRVTFGSAPLTAADDREFIIEHDLGVLTLSEKYRKIQFVEGSWYTAAGDYLVSRELLSCIKRKNASDRNGALKAINTEVCNVVQAVVSQTNLPIDGRYNVRILGAPYKTGNNRAWAAQIYPEDTAAVIAMAQLVANWPFSIDDATKKNAENRFLTTVESSIHAADYMKAAAQMITFGMGAPDCSDYAQIGLTIYEGGDRSKSFYVQGAAIDLANMSNEEIMAHSEPAQ
ncbi:hypothetical protein [Massilia sp. Leaf139]|uniref:hypothetical protein n=1 Tax=Massilia sp. Leaf139 TaxID=1736272 RepID=UPI000B17AE56|nr:hypothetical protein [Massilia sp. Leaf139]